jgi:hypothetical protein
VFSLPMDPHGGASGIAFFCDDLNLSRKRANRILRRFRKSDCAGWIKGRGGIRPPRGRKLENEKATDARGLHFRPLLLPAKEAK